MAISEKDLMSIIEGIMAILDSHTTTLKNHQSALEVISEKLREKVPPEVQDRGEGAE